MNLDGYSELRSLRDGLWRTGIKCPGALGMIPAGETNKLRWRSLTPSGFLSAHLHMPTTLLEESLEERRRAGLPMGRHRRNVLVADDVVSASIIRELVRGLEVETDELHAEEHIRQLADWLASPASARADGDARNPGALDDMRLRRALEFMSADLSINYSLQDIARAAGASVYHFARMFRQATGRPPHAFLNDIRLEVSRDMLERTELPISRIAQMVGYPVPRNFSSAYARRYTMTPTEWRRRKQRYTLSLNELNVSISDRMRR